MKLQLKKRWKVMKAALHMELREHKSSFIVYMTLRILVILMMILQFFNKNYERICPQKYPSLFLSAGRLPSFRMLDGPGRRHHK